MQEGFIKWQLIVNRNYIRKTNASQIWANIVQQGRLTRVWWVKVSKYRQITRYISKTVKDRRIVSIRALSNGDIADDLEWPLTSEVLTYSRYAF